MRNQQYTFSRHSAVEQEVIVTAIKIALYIFTRFLIHTNTRSIEAEQQVCSKTPTPETCLQNLCAYKMWILSNSWATGWPIQLITYWL